MLAFITPWRWTTPTIHIYLITIPEIMISSTLTRRSEADSAGLLTELGRKTRGLNPLFISLDNQVASAVCKKGGSVSRLLFTPHPTPPKGGRGYKAALTLYPSPTDGNRPVPHPGPGARLSPKGRNRDKGFKPLAPHQELPATTRPGPSAGWRCPEKPRPPRRPPPRSGTSSPPSRCLSPAEPGSPSSRRRPRRRSTSPPRGTASR
jgi:hypothetical protein